MTDTLQEEAAAIKAKLAAREFTTRIINPDGPEASTFIDKVMVENAEITRVAQRDAEELRQTRLKVVRQKEEIDRLLAEIERKDEALADARDDMCFLCSETGRDAAEWLAPLDAALSKGSTNGQ